MPTKHPRIGVICDEELAEALARVEALPTGSRMQRARLVHDLAVRGAAVVVDEQTERAKALERLAERSTDPTGLFDRDVLARIDEEAWGYRPEPA